MSCDRHFGVYKTEGRWRFRGFAPAAESVHILSEGELLHSFTVDERGYAAGEVPKLDVGMRYSIRLDDGPVFPDPASRYQPDGVDGPSEVIDEGRYSWQSDEWMGLPLDELVLYELHVGTFSKAGTYEGVIDHLDALADLGINAIELMPVHAFPGERNWGYDPAALFASARPYGRPDELRRLVDEAHQRGIAVFLDVVYNHLGPDGAYAAATMPYLTEKHETPWGVAVNLDDVHAEGIRDFIVANACYWLEQFRIDGLRLDATHALRDDSETHLLAELADAVATLDGPPRHLIAEDHRNERQLLLPRSEGGFGLEACWADDFHHQVRNMIAGDRHAYYGDFADTTAQQIARTLERGWFFEGQESSYLGEPRGTSADGLAPEQFVLFIQNHDQIGNRPVGDRLHESASLESVRAASALLLFQPHLPMLFMGQEWAASAPFLYFTDHHGELGEAVSEGRRNEFSDFPGFQGKVPDPQEEETFRRSVLDWSERSDPAHASMLALHRALLHLRPQLPSSFQVEALSRDALHLTRGPWHLITLLRGSASLDAPEAELLWHTEAERFGGTPDRIRLDEGQIHFDVPGASLLKETS